MNGRGYGLAEVGLFLLLAFVLPGFVYLAFLLFLFPNMFSQMVTTTGFTNNEALFGVLLGIIGGLLLTSVCFFLELCLSRIKLFWLMERVLRKVRIVGREWLLFPNMGIPRLGKFEAAGRSSVYLHQITGQAIMHFNIAMGLLIMLVLYLVLQDFLGENSVTPSFQLARTTVTSIFVFVNFVISACFYNSAKIAMDEVGDCITRSHKGSKGN